MFETNHPAPCRACEGQGTVADCNPCDPRHRLVTCDECCGAGTDDPAAIHAAAENVERGCPLAVSECPLCTQSALDAGIPLSVVRGETKLTDHFSREYIDAQAK